MLENNNALCVKNLSKVYQIYDRPEDRLKQSLYPRFGRLIGRPSRNYYHEFWALKDVSFSVKKGETVGIVGRNGSGKSTLLQLICGTLCPTGGIVETQGRIAALLELGSGFNPEFTGRENVYMNAAVLGLSKNEVDQRYGDIADFADIGQFIDQPIKTYSSGMMVRLAFAVAINVEPEILIIDEALSVGDELFQRKCFSRIEAIRDSGATILFVSHSGSTVVELCDRAVLLDAGEKLAVGLPKAVVGHYHKLIYTAADMYETCRNEILELDDDSIASGDDFEEASYSKHTLPDVKDETYESYDPNLKPVSTVEYKSRGAHIHSATIVTTIGERANNLVRGETYRFVYKVDFTRHASNVRFGMMIKTTSGAELGGCVSAVSSRDCVDSVEEGESYRVEFRFSCNLTPGVYFMNAGVLGNDGKSEIYLKRMIDIVAFKVLPDTSYMGTGIVDFSCYAETRLL
ncbi:MAG: ABC transporter ATP-binding protein [Gammaproteobacteria bacterium]|nr:ABC transporter ATP-binding protein [Gammaproteobacteria bacterium]